MRTGKGPSVRHALLLLAATATSVGVALGLPLKKALAAATELRPAPTTAIAQPQTRLTVIQPKRVDPTTTRLLKITDQALFDKTLAERIFREPDAVASEHHLSNDETLVLRQMTRAQFQTARSDAATLVANRLSQAGSTRLPEGATDKRLITERMIVGRAILAAAGRSYLEAANAHACCPWSGAIELGISSDPALYNPVFGKPAGVKALQPGVPLTR